MKNIKNLFNINIATYFLILTFLFTGLIKNIIIIYLIVIVHELGHIFIIKKLKYKVIRVDIYPMGGVTKINKKINTSIKHEILIAVFGIFFQIVLGIIVLILRNLGFISINTYNLFLNYNRTIMIFNMMPIMPLDGYVIFRSIGEIFFSYKKAFYVSLVVSVIAVVFFITFNEFFSLNNYLIISFLVFKMITILKDFKYEYLKFQLERFLFPLKYDKIKNERKLNLDLLKKDTYHYFKKDDTIISEHKLLERKFAHQTSYLTKS